MNSIKTYWLFWAWIPVVMIVSYFADPVAFNFSFQDGYFAFDKMHLGLSLVFFLFLSGIGYFIINQSRLSPKLEVIHVFASYFGILGMFILIFLKQIFPFSSKHSAIITVAIAALIFISFVGFLFYVMNVLRSLNFRNKE